MNISQIESNVDTLVSGISSGNIPIKHFLYELLLAYGHRKQSVTRLKSGERNLASRDHRKVRKPRKYMLRLYNGSDMDAQRKQTNIAERVLIKQRFSQLFSSVFGKGADTPSNFAPITEAKRRASSGTAATKHVWAECQDSICVVRCSLFGVGQLPIGVSTLVR